MPMRIIDGKEVHVISASDLITDQQKFVIPFDEQEKSVVYQMPYFSASFTAIFTSEEWESIFGKVELVPARLIIIPSDGTLEPLCVMEMSEDKTEVYSGLPVEAFEKAVPVILRVGELEQHVLVYAVYL